MSRRVRTQPGYTLLELLVVIVIASLLVGIAIPAFRGILASSRRTLAESKLQQAMYAARDAATASVGGGDAAAVFFFEPGQGIRVLTCIEVGSILDDRRSTGFTGSGTSGGSGRVTRDVFVPISGFEPVQLPSGVGVRGFVLGSLLAGENDWYEEGLAPRGGRVPPEPGYWVFPETAFYLADVLEAGETRQTFMVRFTAGEGTISRESTKALVVSPSTSGESAVTDIRGLNEADDLEIWAARLLSNVSLTPDDLIKVLGNESVHTVLAGPVTEVSLYEERELARALGARGLNQSTGTLYQSDASEPRIDSSLYDGGNLLLARNASRWIEGRELVRTTRQPAESTARIFAINAFFGDLVEITR